MKAAFLRMESNVVRGERSMRDLRRAYNPVRSLWRADIAGIFASREMVSLGMHGGIGILS